MSSDCYTAVGRPRWRFPWAHSRIPPPSNFDWNGRVIDVDAYKDLEFETLELGSGKGESTIAIFMDPQSMEWCTEVAEGRRVNTQEARRARIADIPRFKTPVSLYDQNVPPLISMYWVLSGKVECGWR
jgi:hypothetical protein